MILSGVHLDVDPDELTTDFPLLESGLIDSFGIREIVSFLEADFGVRIPDEEVTLDNFATISAIARFVDSCPASHGPR